MSSNSARQWRIPRFLACRRGNFHCFQSLFQLAVVPCSPKFKILYLFFILRSLFRWDSITFSLGAQCLTCRQLDSVFQEKCIRDGMSLISCWGCALYSLIKLWIHLLLLCYILVEHSITKRSWSSICRFILSVEWLMLCIKLAFDREIRFCGN